jgi:hypothetical protein
MKITNKLILTTCALLFSLPSSAHLLQYNLSLETTIIEGVAFGGVKVGDVFQGTLSIDTHELQEIADADGGFATVLVPLQDENDNFNLSYTIQVGNAIYTEQTAGSFDAEFSVDNPAEVEDVVDFSLEIGDLLSLNDLDASGGISMNGDWFATDGETGNSVSGVLTVSVAPTPSATSIPIHPAHSGSWFDPAMEGRGGFVNVADVNGQQVVVMTWLDYNEDGSQMWVVGSSDPLEANATKVTVSVQVTQQNTSGELIKSDWGRFSFEFSSCDSARLIIQPDNGTSKTLALSRLTKIAGMSCSG